MCLLQLHRFDVLEESVLVSRAQLLFEVNDVALEETNDCCPSHSLQPVACLLDDPPQPRIPGIHFEALPRCGHRISHSLQFSFRPGVSTPTSPWSPSFLGWDYQFSGPHDDCGEWDIHVVHTAVSRRVCPEVPSIVTFSKSLRSRCLVRMSRYVFRLARWSYMIRRPWVC